MRTRIFPIAVLAIAASQLGATDCGEIVSDPGFDLWCGDQLCSWKIDHGDVRQVPTWHEGDDGAELVGDAAIYQLTPVTSSDGACIEFELVADVAAGVDVRFQADVFGDGSIELDEQIPSADWQPLVYRFGITGPYQGVKFWITKRGEGHAVVAQLQAHTCDADQATQMITGLPAPDGAHCGGAADCQSGTCEMFEFAFAPPPTCGGCEVGGTCPNAGDVCGLALPTQYTLGSSTACVPPASKQLGELCGVNPECANGGLCVFGVCSTCFDTSCGPGITCGPGLQLPRPDGYGDYPVAFVCDPGGGLRAAGEPCFSGADCTSGQCAGGERRICNDGRPCANGADCPVVDGLAHGSCEIVGLIGGTCQ